MVVGDSASVTALGHYGDHPRSLVADRRMPSRTVKRVAPDKEGVTDKQCLGEENSDFKPVIRAAADDLASFGESFA